MTDDIKVYNQETIEDTAFPQEETTDFNTSQSTASGVYSPQTIKSQPVTKKRVATELLSTSLNTKSKKILGEYQFTEQGAIQVGSYKNGVSGDLRLSPNGIVARDSSGNTTFAIDGTTGNATFSGELQAGTLVTGAITINNGLLTIQDENDVTVLDSKGIVGNNVFTSGSLNKEADQSIAGDYTWTDITTLTFDITLTRSVPILFFGMVFYQLGGSDADCMIRINYGGSFYPSANGWNASIIPTGDTTNFGHLSFTQILTIPAGTTTVKLQGARSTPDETLSILGGDDTTRSTFGYVILGN